MGRRIVLSGLWVAVGLLAGCSRDPVLNDTGYAGTWSRGNDWVTSIVAIHRDGDGYRVRVGKYSADGKFRTSCDWDGACVETKDGAKVAEIRYRWWIDEATGHLFVAYDEKRLDQGEGPTEMKQTDEMIVEGGGLDLVALTRERNGEKYPGATPRRSFRKVSDSVAFPPDVRYR